MGQQSVNKTVIDETFSGLLDPKEIHEMGREDIISDRPGAILLSAVSSFGAEGFKAIAKEREDKRHAADAADKPQTKSDLTDFGLGNKAGHNELDNKLGISDE